MDILFVMYLGRVDENEEEIMVEYDSEKLLKFLQKASQVCVILRNYTCTCIVGKYCIVGKSNSNYN